MRYPDCTMNGHSNCPRCTLSHDGKDCHDAPKNPMVYYRTLNGMTQADVAKKVGCTQKDISRWENGVRTPTVANLIKLSAAIGCSLEELSAEIVSKK